MDDRAPFYQLLSMTRALKVVYREIDKICSKYFTESSIINPFIGFHSIVEVNDAEYSISPQYPDWEKLNLFSEYLLRYTERGALVSHTSNCTGYTSDLIYFAKNMLFQNSMHGENHFSPTNQFHQQKH